MYDVYQHLPGIAQGVLATVLAGLPLWLMTSSHPRSPDPLPVVEAVPPRPASSRFSGRLSSRTSLKNPSPVTPTSLAISGGSRSVSLIIGVHTSADITPQEQYRLISQRFRPPSNPGSDFRVTAEIKEGSWSPESLQVLGKELNSLREEVGIQRWRKMTILLPTVELPPGAVRQIVVALPHLESLIWQGHRQQLPQWSFFNEVSSRSSVSTLPSLTSLILRCDISIEDCAFLLLQATSVTHFEIHTLRDVDPVLPKASFGILLGHHPRPYLETLIISSSCTASIGPMLDHFDFPRLQKINFDLSGYAPNFDAGFSTIYWRNLNEVRLRCDMTTDTSHLIRDRCGYGTIHSHIITRNLSSKRNAETLAPSSPRIRTGAELMQAFPFIEATLGMDQGVPASMTVRRGHGSAVVSLVQ
ncbi:hypothetical protein FPV67DRAFT_1110013 [Lyophyllum atratum]|nr:hypothetical protein FPV67DRAFT_1110013 [Lyophyllum atratum]